MRRNRFVVLFIIISLFVLVAYLSQKVSETIDFLQKNIETRALPVLRKDIPLLRKKLFGFVPSVQSIFDHIKVGPLDAGKITDKTIDFVAQPFIDRALERTRQDLNKELGFVKIYKLEYTKEGKRKTITAHCSYGIVVVITGKHFKKIESRERTGLWLTFICD